MVDPSRIWASASLPTLPSVAIRLLDLSRDPDVEIDEVVDVIRQDPAIAARILKATNSSLFGFRHEVTSLDRAVPLLGTTVVTSLALSFSLVEAAMNTGAMAVHYSNYWRQSVVQGVAAEILSHQHGAGLECEYFLAGLLSDLGRLAMLKTIPDEYLPALEQAEAERMALVDSEREHLGFDHVTIGLKLMENWKLPPTLREAVGLHHAPPGEIQTREQQGQLPLSRATMMAAAAGDYCCSADSGPALNRLRELGTAFYQFPEEQLAAFLEQLRERLDSVSDLFSIDVEQMPGPEELMAQANEHLAELTMREHIAGSQAAARSQQAELENRELQTANQQLQRQALRDPLTGIYNRQFFDESLAREAERCCREAAPLAVVFCDIDHFKQLNDTRGHRFGDQVLQQIATAFTSALRKSDVLARFGGEEFVIIVNQPTEKGLARLAERIRSRIEEEVVECDGERVPVTISVGAAIAVPKRNESGLTETLVVEADAAMYDSKRNGRNQVHLRSLVDESDRRMAARVLEQRFSRWLVSRKVLDIPAVSRAVLKCSPRRIRIGELAEQQGWLSPNDICRILEDQQTTSERFGQVATRLGLLTEQQVAMLIALQQEDPATLAGALVDLQLIERNHIEQLREEYLSASCGLSAAVQRAAAPGGRTHADGRKQAATRGR